MLGHYDGRSSTPNHYPDCYLHLTIKDKGMMGNGIFLGEAFLPLSDIGGSDVNKCLKDFPQLQLPLTKPTDHGGYREIHLINLNKLIRLFSPSPESDIMLALDSRNFDRVAKEFLNRERKKL